MKTTVAKCAAEIRTLLKKEFPNIKFKVSSSSYSGGDSVRVSYVDALPTKMINEKIAHFQYGSFDGMTDCYNMDNKVDGISQTKYLFVDRQMSEETKEKIMNEYIRKFVGAENAEYNDYNCAAFREPVSMIVHRKFCELTIN